MYYLLVKFKQPNIERWVNWNESTFPMRNSMGLVSVMVYQDQDEEDSYFAMSIWQDEASAKDYLSDRQVKESILSSPDIEWYKELKFDEAKSIKSIEDYNARMQD